MALSRCVYRQRDPMADIPVRGIEDRRRLTVSRRRVPELAGPAFAERGMRGYAVPPTLVSRLIGGARCSYSPKAERVPPSSRRDMRLRFAEIRDSI